MFNATFNNISAISWQSVLLVEKTWVIGENHRPVASHWVWAGFDLRTSVVIGTDCICSYKSNYHTIMTAPQVINATQYFILCYTIFHIIISLCFNTPFKIKLIYIDCNHLILSICCACPMTRPGFPTSYVVFPLFWVQWAEMKGDCLICWYW